MNRSLLYIINFWLKSNKYNLKDFEIWYASHPDFPSLKSLTDTLNYFGIESLTAEIDEQTLLSFDKPFLSLIKSDNAEHLVYTIIEKDGIKILTDKHKFYTLTLVDFLKKWKNVVVVVDQNKNSQSKIKLIIMFYLLYYLYVTYFYIFGTILVWLT